MKNLYKILTSFLIITSTFVTAGTTNALEYQGRLLKPGLSMQGSDVKEVQQCLLDMGFDLPIYGADGWYGAETYQQIRSYQLSEGLRFVDGIVGPETISALTCNTPSQEPSDIFESITINKLDIKESSSKVTITGFVSLNSSCTVISIPKISIDDMRVDVDIQADTVTSQEDCQDTVKDVTTEVSIDKDSLDEGNYTLYVNDNKKYEFDIHSTIETTNPTENVKISSRTINVDGSDNDTAEFIFEFDLNSFGNKAYVSERANESIDFVISRANDGVVVYESDGPTQLGFALSSLSSDGDLEDSYYRINEDDNERFEFNLSYSPYGGTPAHEGSYRVQIKNINYKLGSVSGSSQSYQTSGLSKFRSASVNIID